MAQDTIKMSGKVIDVINASTFKVALENGITIDGILGGKMKLHHVGILKGDMVQVELSPYDLTKGRIIYREK
ncbi:MAG: translation initiation factor IF-1 [Mycoplasmataceae bacterium]|jgi:translation initiation factor IF-1|nr:translation initiation factor IF-1 [Mycoplasmataceae bacterium]